MSNKKWNHEARYVGDTCPGGRCQGENSLNLVSLALFAVRFVSDLNGQLDFENALDKPFVQVAILQK
jgi:hypothetical protein